MVGLVAIDVVAGWLFKCEVEKIYVLLIKP